MVERRKEEIKEGKRIRLFASFMNKEHQQAVLDEVLKEMPKHHQHKLYLYLGMMDSTIAEGYSDESKEV
jgi:putative IMPACT (imprinted ancient) family translation regulator